LDNKHSVIVKIIVLINFINKDDELILNKNPNYVHLGVKSDTVGPGQYNIKGSIESSIQKKKGFDFSKSRVTRTEKISSASTADLGPGISYYIC
jgi:hypothetical protein